MYGPHGRPNPLCQEGSVSEKRRCQVEHGLIHQVNYITSSPPVQNGGHFPNDIFRCIFANENFVFFMKISLNSVPKGPVDNSQSLV